MEINNSVLTEIDAGGVHIRFGKISPKNHDIVIASIGAKGGTGELNRYVSAEIEIPVPTIEGATSSEYFVRSGKDFIFVAIATTGTGRKVNFSVQSGLTTFFSSMDHKAFLSQFAPRLPRYWIPLMGTGVGGLPFPVSARATFDAIASSLSLFPKGAEISVSIPELGRDLTEEIFNIFVGWSWADPDTGDVQVKNSSTHGIETLDLAEPSESESPRDSGSSSIAASDSPSIDSLEPGDTPPETFNDADFRFDRPVEDAAQDTLDRKAIAEAIAQKVTGVWRAYQTQPQDAPDSWKPRYPSHPFIVHLAGRWGSGKSSILNFIAELLQGKHPDEDKHTAYQVALPPPTGRTWSDAHRDWVVIEFNAWRQQGTGHAWWALMTALSAQAPAQIGARGAHFKRRDAWWRFNSSWRNWIIGGAAIITLLLFWWAFSGTASPTLNDGLKAIGGIITAVVGIVAFTGTFATRSKRTAEAIQNLEIDPTAALKRRFEAMIREIHNPVAIFIDDLDRCDAAYVVELLQALQTVYADVPVLYVVAADRNWLVSAYDQTYAKFTGAISEKGQALGYLFVKKIFQLSVNVPDLSDTDQRDFLKSLLPDGHTTQPPEQVLDDIEASVAGTTTLEALAQVVAAQPTEATKRAAGRAALSKLMTEKTTQQVAHLLVTTLAPEGAVPLLDPNPRAITRLVNAYSFRLGYALRAGELGVIGKLPYWSVLDLRFPTAAKRLADKPDLRTDDAWKAEPEADHFPDPEAIAPILKTLTAADIKILRSFG